MGKILFNKFRTYAWRVSVDYAVSMNTSLQRPEWKGKITDELYLVHTDFYTQDVGKRDVMLRLVSGLDVKDGKEGCYTSDLHAWMEKIELRHADLWDLVHAHKAFKELLWNFKEGDVIIAAGSRIKKPFYFAAPALFNYPPEGIMLGLISLGGEGIDSFWGSNINFLVKKA